MNFLILNGSPKRKNSITLQTILYLKAKNPKHNFDVIDISGIIHHFEKYQENLSKKIEKADCILFCYPVYICLAPYCVHRIFELLHEFQISLKGKFATQITTSKHFYDTTAHAFVKENLLDFGCFYLPELSADMDDLLVPSGQKEADDFFSYCLFSMEQGLYEKRALPSIKSLESYHCCLPEIPKKDPYTVSIITNCKEEDFVLKNLILDFQNTLPYPSKVVSLCDFPFQGSCVGCFSCAFDGKCIYSDGFETFLKEQVLSSDATIYAFTIQNHYTGSLMKLFEDRQFCNGHRMVSMGKPVGYLINGSLSSESNLQLLIEAKSQVGFQFLTYVATTEREPTSEIQKLSSSLCYALERKLSRPQNFYGVGGTKIFRDLIYLMRGMMQEDHRFYKNHGFYDFPQKKKKKIAQMYLVGTLMKLGKKKISRAKMNQAILKPYQQIIAQSEK